MDVSQVTVHDAKCISNRSCYLRHDNDAEVQPVPRISQEGERHDAESSREYLYGRLESVNTSESISEKYSQRKNKGSSL